MALNPSNSSSLEQLVLKELNISLDVFQNASSLSKQTALAWSTDYSYLAVGSDDGFVFFRV